MKSSSFFWGSFLISLGLYFLLKNLGINFFGHIDLLQFWPVILIVWGCTFFKMPKWLSLSLSALSGLLMCVLVISLLGYAKWHNGNWGWHFNNNKNEKISEDLDSNNYQKLYMDYQNTIKTSEFNFDGGAGEFKIGGKTDKLYYVNAGGTYSKITSDINDSLCKIDYEYVLDNVNIDNQALDRFSSISLNSTPDWLLNLNVGASKVELDLQEYRINTLNVDAGASDINIRLGSLQDSSEINLDAGVSKIVIEIPKESGCSVNASTGLSKNSFKDFIQKEEDYYITDNYFTSKKKINISINGGLSKFKIVRY